MLYYAMATWLAPYLISLGHSHEAAGFGLMVFQLVGIAGSLLTPVFLRGRWKRWVPAAVPVVGAIGWVGMLLAPTVMPVWLVVGGLAGGAQLAVSLTLMAERARTGEVAAALSGMAQSVGYAVAALGPALFGLFLGLTGDWTLSFLFVCAAAAVQCVVGLAVRRERFVLEHR